MKHLVILFSLFIAASSLKSQPYYFSKANQSFEFLEDSISINNGALWSGFKTFTIPIGFAFKFMDKSFSTVKLEATGRLIFDANHYYYADLFVVSGLQDKGIASSLSPLSYKLSGTTGNRILKIEIKNATFSKDLSSTINYQIWLYENNSKLELHMGPNTIVNTANAFTSGPYCGLFHVSTYSPLTYNYGLAIYGNPTTPFDSTCIGTGINTFGLKLNNTLADGSVYQFSTITHSNNTSTLNNSTPNFTLFPNPSNLNLNIQIKNSSNSIERVIVYSVTGQELINYSNNTKLASVNVSNLPLGVYRVLIQTDKENYSSSFIKN